MYLGWAAVALHVHHKRHDQRVLIVRHYGWYGVAEVMPGIVAVIAMQKWGNNQRVGLLGGLVG